MSTYDDITKAQKNIIEYWGEDGKKVIEATSKVVPFNRTFEEFLDYCVACGGNWCGMLLSGLQKLYPSVWEAIPTNMGVFAWNGICSTLILCGIDTKEEN